MTIGLTIRNSHRALRERSDLPLSAFFPPPLAASSRRRSIRIFRRTPAGDPVAPSLAGAQLERCNPLACRQVSRKGLRGKALAQAELC